MNRIKEIRLARGLSAEELGKLVGCSHQQIYRLEDGKRKLTVEWIEKIAAALSVAPADILASSRLIEQQDDVEPETGPQFAEIVLALRTKGLLLYRVCTDSLANAGYPIGKTITVDGMPEAVQKRKTGDAILVRLGETVDNSRLVLRQFVPPHIIVTNRPGTNLVSRLDDPAIAATVIGVVIRD